MTVPWNDAIAVNRFYVQLGGIVINLKVLHTNKVFFIAYLSINALYCSQLFVIYINC